MYLLDTCTLIWLASDHAKLSQPALQAIGEEEATLFVSAISAFELGIKHGKGALTLPLEPDSWYAEVLDFHGLHEISVNGRIAARSTMLPRLHSDPCDRILVATAEEHGLRILTPDPLIRAYPRAETLW